MTYVIVEACIGVKDRACVDVCPVDCIYEGEDQLYIHPDECIDCGACEPECPVTAIFPEEDVPREHDVVRREEQRGLQQRHPAGAAAALTQGRRPGAMNKGGAPDSEPLLRLHPTLQRCCGEPFILVAPIRPAMSCTLSPAKERSPGIELLGRDPGAKIWKDHQRGRMGARRAADPRTRVAGKRFQPTTRRNSRIAAGRLARALHGRYVAGVRDDDQPRARNRRGHAAGSVRGRERVLLADDDEGGQPRERRQESGAVVPIPHRGERPDDPGDRRGRHDSADAVDHFGGALRWSRTPTAWGASRPRWLRRRPRARSRPPRRARAGASTPSASARVSIRMRARTRWRQRRRNSKMT